MPGRAFTLRRVHFAKKFRMVGYCGKIQWLDDVVRPSIDSDCFALGKTVCITRRQSRTTNICVEGIRRVYMCLTKVGALQRFVGHGGFELRQ